MKKKLLYIPLAPKVNTQEHQTQEMAKMEARAPPLSPLSPLRGSSVSSLREGSGKSFGGKVVNDVRH